MEFNKNNPPTCWRRRAGYFYKKYASIRIFSLTLCALMRII
nr:MAG TPA: hypothetical protein [Caudoviricetes sp.]